MLSQDDVPPFERGITWSTVRCEWPVPQYWQVHLSRAKIARRGVLRLWGGRGTRTEGVRRVTGGGGNWDGSPGGDPAGRSRVSARSLHTRTPARRPGQPVS